MLAELPLVAFEWGIDVNGISSSSHDRQRRLAELAKLSNDRIQAGETDEDILAAAQDVSWGAIAPSISIPAKDAIANAEFFIGSQLYAMGDRRCRPYFFRSLRSRPLRVRTWGKYALSLLMTGPVDA